MLRARRLQLGISQAQVASALGWRQSVVGDVELARRRLNVYELIDYAEALSTDPVALFEAVVREDMTDVARVCEASKPDQQRTTG